MITITRRFGGIPREYHIYTQREADEHDIPYRHWTFCHAGSYALTDDGYVGLLVKRQRYRLDDNTINDLLTFSFARKWLRRKANGTLIGNPNLEAEPYLEKGAYYGTAPKTWIEQEKTRTRAQRAAKLYARLYLAREGKLREEDWRALGIVYRPDQTMPALTVKKLLRQEDMMNMIASELKKLLADEGITFESVLRKYVKILDQAMDVNQLGVAKGVNDKLAELVGLKHEPDPGEREFEEIDYELLEAEIEQLNAPEPRLLEEENNG